jgi:methenyltetrahydromethanopterin cyclohydrolase
MFENSLTEIHRGVGEPESAARFEEKYTDLALKVSAETSDDFESDFVEVISDCQFDGFVLGFNTAVKFLLGCAMEKGLNI